MQTAVKEVVFGLKSVVEDVEQWDEFHRHDDIQLGFYDSGPVLYQVGRKTYIIEENDCVMCWSGIPHRVRDSPVGNKQYWITVPLELFIRWSLPREYTTAILSGELLTVKQGKFKDIDKILFQQWQHDLQNNNDEYRHIVSISFEARFRRFCVDYASAEKKKVSQCYEDKTSFAKICQYITDNYKEKITVDDISRHVDLHPSYAMNLFRKNCGYTINTMITMMRINEAQRLLSTTELSILDIALVSGFQTVSNFYAAFKKHCNKTPKEYRKTSFIDC